MRSSNSATASALRTTDLLVLAVLGEDRPQHGYGLAQEIAARTKGQVVIRAADLHPARCTAWTRWD